MRQEGTSISIEFDKLDSKYSNQVNNETKYQKIEYNFERAGQILTIALPFLEFSHLETGFRQVVSLENKEILDIIEKEFDNLNEIVEKYLDQSKLEHELGKTGVNRHSIPEED